MTLPLSAPTQVNHGHHSDRRGFAVIFRFIAASQSAASWRKCLRHAAAHAGARAFAADATRAFSPCIAQGTVGSGRSVRDPRCFRQRRVSGTCTARRTCRSCIVTSQRNPKVTSNLRLPATMSRCRRQSTRRLLARFHPCTRWWTKSLPRLPSRRRGCSNLLATVNPLPDQPLVSPRSRHRNRTRRSICANSRHFRPRPLPRPRRSTRRCHSQAPRREKLPNPRRQRRKGRPRRPSTASSRRRASFGAAAHRAGTRAAAGRQTSSR